MGNKEPFSSIDVGILLDSALLSMAPNSFFRPLYHPATQPNVSLCFSWQRFNGSEAQWIRNQRQKRRLWWIVFYEAMGSLAKLLSCSFLMYQPEVTQPALASASALKVLSEPKCSPPLWRRCQVLSRVFVWGVSGGGGWKNIKNVWVVHVWGICTHEFIWIIYVVGGERAYAWMEVDCMFVTGCVIKLWVFECVCNENTFSVIWVLECVWMIWMYALTYVRILGIH